MNVLITGGTGFIGKQLADCLLRMDRFSFEDEPAKPIAKIVIFDAFPPAREWNDPRVEMIVGDVGDQETVARAAKGADIVWHLAAIVSSDAEANFDRGMHVNLTGTLNLLAALRSRGNRPRVVNASSLAVFGGDLPEVVTDRTALTPKTSYGTQKAIGELLIADYTRKGFIDGRSLRLPTITVRPGKPNKAASTFVSSIIREPLARQPVVCPVRAESLVYISSPRRAVDAMIRAMQLSAATLGSDRTILLPGLTLTVGDMVSTLGRIAGPAATKLIRWEPDETIQRIVDGWPGRVQAARAPTLGFMADRNFDEIVRAHIEDEHVAKWWEA